jgi:hypothetical protein
MAHYQIYAERDATLYEKKKQCNTGIDQILEIISTKSGSILDNLYQNGTYNSRILIDFKGTQFTALSQSIVDGEIGATNRRFYLNVKSVYATDNPIAYDLKAFPVSQSWTNGNGNYADVPETRNGVSWQYRTGDGAQRAWKTGSAHSKAESAGAEEVEGGGTWITGTGNEASQSFDYESPDIRMDVTDIVENWIDNSYKNYGFILKLTPQQETGSDDNYNLKFFSRDTHTVYAPRLECVWKDSTHNGTATIVHQTDNGGPVVYFKNIEEKYAEGSRVQFRIGARPKYPPKTYTTSSFYLADTYRLPHSSSYAVQDAVTGETLLDYDDTYTRISFDADGSHFTYWMDALSPERYYKFKIRSKYLDGTIKYFDNGYYFKVVR